jgi:hypothetical protein
LEEINEAIRAQRNVRAYIGKTQPAGLDHEKGVNLTLTTKQQQAGQDFFTPKFVARVIRRRGDLCRVMELDRSGKPKPQQPSQDRTWVGIPYRTGEQLQVIVYLLFSSEPQLIATQNVAPENLFSLSIKPR